jgi:hypothetical protein
MIRQLPSACLPMPADTRHGLRNTTPWHLEPELQRRPRSPSGWGCAGNAPAAARSNRRRSLPVESLRSDAIAWHLSSVSGQPRGPRARVVCRPVRPAIAQRVRPRERLVMRSPAARAAGPHRLHRFARPLIACLRIGPDPTPAGTDRSRVPLAPPAQLRPPRSEPRRKPLSHPGSSRLRLCGLACEHNPRGRGPEARPLQQTCLSRRRRGQEWRGTRTRRYPDRFDEPSRVRELPRRTVRRGRSGTRSRKSMRLEPSQPSSSVTSRTPGR